MVTEQTKWQENYKVHSFLTDRYCRLSIPAVSQLFQETAEAHTNAYDMGYHSMIKDNKAWVLLRVYYEITDYPDIYTDISMQTWSRGFKGVTALRDFVIQSADGRAMIKGTSTWCVIDMLSRYPQRCDKIMEHFPKNDDVATDKVLGKMVPCEDYDTAFEFKVPFMAIDKAQHTNNAMYMRWIMNALPCDMQEKAIKSVDISYVHETKMDDTITVQYNKTDDNVYNFRLLNSSGVAMLCTITFKN